MRQSGIQMNEDTGDGIMEEHYKEELITAAALIKAGAIYGERDVIEEGVFRASAVLQDMDVTEEEDTNGKD